LLDVSTRNDGSSKFGSNNRYGTFSSIGLGWRLSEENFIKNIKEISELKLRVSYGESGNANIGSFSWQSRLISSNYSYGTNRLFGTVPLGYLNPNLTWEKNHQFDVGLELGLLKDKIYITIDYYKKVTTDMILNKQLLSIVGYASTYNNNTGNLQNTGIELGIATKNIQKRNLLGHQISIYHSIET